MNFLAPAVTAAIKSTLESTLTERWTINQRSFANSGSGPVATLSVRASDVHGRSAIISDRSVGERTNAGSVREKEEIILTLPITQTIVATDQVVNQATGRKYEVVREETTQHKTFCKRVVCKAE